MPEWCRFRAAYTYYEIIAPYVNKHTHTPDDDDRCAARNVNDDEPHAMRNSASTLTATPALASFNRILARHGDIAE